MSIMKGVLKKKDDNLVFYTLNILLFLPRVWLILVQCRCFFTATCSKKRYALEKLAQMQSLAKSLPEHSVVRAMGGVGEVLAAKLIAEIGDVRRFHHGKSLISYVGIDSAPYQSGQFTAQNRRISKRGSAYL